MFEELIGDTVLLRRGGRFWPAKLYHRRGLLYAKDGRYFLRLQADGGCSDQKTSFRELSCELEVFAARSTLNALTLDGENGKPLRAEMARTILFQPADPIKALEDLREGEQ
jgi:hypothetical protein